MRAEPQSDIRDVFDTVAEDYDRTGVEFFGPVGERLVELTDIRPGDAVLDVGCGRGAVLLPAARATGPSGRAIGIDLSFAMVAAVRRDAHARGLRQADAVVMDGQTPSFCPAGFDAVTGGMSVHMLSDLPAAYRAYHRLLRPGGRLALSAPTTVDHPQTRVFGLHSVARLSAGHDTGSTVYPNAPAFGGTALARSQLAAAGFQDIKAVEESTLITAASAEHFLRWTWTHGMRALWERIPAAERRLAEEEIVAEARARSEAPDKLVLRVPILYLLAHRP
ncbi:class I SAM-dependent methyltransferase [Streptomyces huiliensis]|uniref:class I SAM-dependent methyltransferase n=1 Tax=Streptomyces huiliensis TaxID=2876027 RepID=UPI001CBF3EB7|nr:class I SAM-dependent methyltransferase [Streptomyces huiliensis]MBZ4322754.1 methyltransferase domain-containing protein [Streptomyces huiliensis]